MKHFLKKVAAVSVVYGVVFLLSGLTRQDPVWYLLFLWLWKDLSETLDKKKEGDNDRERN